MLPQAGTDIICFPTSSRPRLLFILDADLMRHETLNAHPLRNTMTTTIASADLTKFLEATGHAPRIVELGAARARDRRCGS